MTAGYDRRIVAADRNPTIFVINLDASAERLAHAARQLQEQGLDFERIPAVDGRALPAERLAQLCPARPRRYFMPLTPGEVGCYLSHLRALSVMLERRLERCVILEDDCVLAPGFARCLRDVQALGPRLPDVVKLYGARSQGEIIARLADGRALVRSSSPPSQTTAALWTDRGARKLLAASDRLFRPVDVQLKHWWEMDLDVAWVAPPPVSDGATLVAQSTIGDRRAPGTRHRLARVGYRWSYVARRHLASLQAGGVRRLVRSLNTVPHAHLNERRDEATVDARRRRPGVTVVTVAYNSSHVIARMLASVPTGVPTTVVDNRSADLERLREICGQHGAALVESDRNLGFGAGCNLGAESANAEWLLFLNPDAELAPDAIDRLMAAADRYPAAAAMNPRLILPDGSQYFMRRSYLLPKSAWLPRGSPKADREVTVLCGAAMMVRASAFARVGGFDARMFLYHEDDDLSIRLASTEGTLMFIRDAVVRHGGGASSGDPAKVAAFKAWHMGRSRVYGAVKHGRPFARSRGIAHALLQLCSPAVAFSHRKRAKQMGYLRGCISALGPGTGAAAP